MTRSEAREIAMRMCFGLSANERPAEEVLDEMLDEEYFDSLREEDSLYNSYPSKKQAAYIRQLTMGVSSHSAELDGYVSDYSTGWKFHRISRTALAIMKVAMYEVMYMTDIPDGVAINEAVELAKRYDEPETVPYINGVLGTFFREEMENIR